MAGAFLAGAAGAQFVERLLIAEIKRQDPAGTVAAE